MSLLIKKVLEKIKNIDNKLKTNIVTDIEMEQYRRQNSI